MRKVPKEKKNPKNQTFSHTITHKAWNRGILYGMTFTCVQTWVGEKKKEVNKPLKLNQLSHKQENETICVSHRPQAEKGFSPEAAQNASKPPTCFKTSDLT